MDELTLDAYDRDAAAFADDWHAQPPPTDLHDTVDKYFQPGPTADIGCGSGRDTAWLASRGFQVVGYDASSGLLDQARKRYPYLAFHSATLPQLAGIAGDLFENVLCETVIMHLDSADVPLAVQRLLDILVPGGTLYLTWRVTGQVDKRDENGRLYAAFDPKLVFDAMPGATVLLDEQRGSISSGKIIRRLAVRK